MKHIRLEGEPKALQSLSTYTYHSEGKEETKEGRNKRSKEGRMDRTEKGREIIVHI
jgi:hypothetical protein